MNEDNQKILDALIAAFMNKDLEASLALFADDAVVYDPHYPIPRMEGKPAIRQGFEWGLSNMEQPGFTVRHLWGDDTSGAVEVDTHHVFKGGMALKFDQVFVYETRDGLITRLQSYVPYPPGGIGGLLARITRWAWKLKGKA
ncbi:MAG: nuclear transport factor 2 family protein [Anaerolineaceae bacterium]|nr:nuclear transport factor 2 family protein [Anaerolineaceae bacterium]